ncbi:MAG: InlB B-repeat-containing protein [Oscillospiraceae bacterium]|nr:InlB B-repeat-containing protein [Oscillospiraceae bacterium]
MKKRFAIWTLAFCLALVMLPVRAWAAAGGGSEAGNLTWSYDQNTKRTTVSGTGAITAKDVSDFWSQRPLSMGALIISDGITAIGDDAFGDVRYGISSVTIAGGVKSIGAKAFYDCHSLASVTISGDDVEVGDQAFANCYSLIGLTFSGSIKSIGAKAFYDCDKLADVTFPGDVGPIGEYAFSECDKLASVTFSGKVGSIGGYAFCQCSSLVTCSIPDGAASLGQSAFIHCDKLTTVYIPNSAAIGTNPFLYCEKLRDIYYGGTQEEWEREGKPKVSFDNGFPIIHYEAEGLPPTTAHNAEELLALLRAGDEAGAALTYIDLDGDIQLDSTTGGLVIPEKRAVQLDLKGHRIISDTVFPMATVRGELTVLDSTVTSEPVVDADDKVTYTAGGFFATTIGDKAAIAVEDGGSFTLRGGKIEAEGTAISADNNQALSGIWDASRVQIDSGYVRAGSGPAVSLYRRGGVTVSGGVLISERNTVIDASDAPEARSGAFSGVSMYGGILISKGAPTGSLPCGIYFPQHGSVSFTHGEIRARGGIGILMRKSWLRIERGGGGNDPTITVSKSGTGKIGSSPLELESGHCVVLDEKSGYVDILDDAISFELDKVLPEAFQPHAYASGGNQLRVVTSDFGRRSIYSFGPDTVHAVTFDANGSGAEDIVLETNTDQRIEDWPTPTREGYVFRGWAMSADSLYAVADNYEFEEDTTLYAIWIPEGSHVVDFIIYKDLGTIFARCVTGPDGRVTEWPQNPPPGTHPLFDETYTFVGWHLGITRIERDHIFTEDTVLTSYWEKDPGPYTITFDLNGGTGSGGEKTTDEKGILAADQWPEDPTREGYLFKGWTKFKDSSFTVTPEDNFYSDTTLYARWTQNDTEEKTYTITFDPNDGTGGGTLTTDANGKLSALPANPTRTGYTFDGWYTAKSGGSKVTTSTPFKEDTTVYAHWTQNSTTPADKTYTVTFDANGGSVSPSSAVTNADGKVSLPTPARTGYTFAGWYTAPSGGTRVGASMVFSANTTVYAQWSQLSDTPSAVYYQIYTPGVTYGGSFSVSHTYAAPGTLVTVAASPWSNYELSQLLAIRADTGREVYFTGSYYNQYTFLMPDSDVQLIGSYAQTYTGIVTPSYPETNTGAAYPEAHAYTKPVNWYYSGGYIYHVTDGLVPAGTALTRDMLISVLYNMDSSSSGNPTIWAAENDIVPDIYRSGLWGPDKSISREQAAMILFCYAQHKGYATNQRSSLTNYTDYNQIRLIARPAMAWSRAIGLITATSARTLAPQAILTCGEANAILTRFISGVASAW